MFKIDPNHAFWWKIEFKWPKDDGSGHADKSFKAQFRRMNADEFLERTKTVMAADENDTDAITAIREIMRAVFLDFKDIEFDGDDRDAVKDWLLGDTAIIRSMYQGYNVAILGREITEGN